MMPPMKLESAESVGLSGRLAELVDAYARRVCPLVLAQHEDESVSSALGIWLLLAACVTGAVGEERAALEEALGCSADQAAALLETFMSSPPRALKAAIAVWVAVADATSELAQWVRGLPAAVESGFMPTKREANAWTDRKTLGLIKSFPLEIDASTRIVLASALATKVSWPVPFDLVEADEHLGAASPWRGMFSRLLWDGYANRRAMLVDTRSAGVVAVHQAMAEEELTVISVSADPLVQREAVLAAAHEIAACARERAAPAARSLFDLPLGEGHSWAIEEHETRTFDPGERIERIAGASLPAWNIESKTNLLAERFGTEPALETMGQLIGAGPQDPSEAVQVAVASFTRYGFEAAAVTGFARAASSRRDPDQPGLERTAVLRFDHPYAALAIAGNPVPQRREGFIPTIPWNALPLFSAWINKPVAADEPQAGRHTHLNLNHDGHIAAASIEVRKPAWREVALADQTPALAVVRPPGGYLVFSGPSARQCSPSYVCQSPAPGASSQA